MEFSDSFIRLMREFMGNWNTRSSTTATCLTEMNPVVMTLEIPIKNLSAEIPLFCLSMIEEYMNTNSDKNVILPIYLKHVGYTGVAPSGADTALRYIIRNTECGQLAKVTTTKGETY